MSPESRNPYEDIVGKSEVDPDTIARRQAAKERLAALSAEQVSVPTEHPADTDTDPEDWHLSPDEKTSGLRGVEQARQIAKGQTPEAPDQDDQA